MKYNNQDKPQSLENPEARQQDLYLGRECSQQSPWRFSQSHLSQVCPATCAAARYDGHWSQSDLLFPSRLCSDNDFLNRGRHFD